MRLNVTVKTSSKQEYIRRIDDAHYVVAVHQPPRDGRANKVVLRILARHLDLSISRLHMKRGVASKRKVVEVS